MEDEIYIYKGKEYTRQMLDEKYGDRAEEAISQFGYKKREAPKKKAGQEYELEGKIYTRDQIEQKYGEKAEEAISHFGYKDLSPEVKQEEIANVPVPEIKKKDDSEPISQDPALASDGATEVASGSAVSIETKVDDTPGFLESIKNTASNVVTSLEGVLPRINVVSADVWEAVLGKELAEKFYKNDPIAQQTLEGSRNEAYEKLNELEKEVKNTRGFVESWKDRDAAGLTAATADAIGQLAATAIPSVLSGGAALFTEMTGRSIVEYNTTKAEQLDIPVDELYSSGKAELGVPLTIGIIGGSLERVGLKGITSAITAKVRSKGIKEAASIFNSSNKEGLTEFVQTGLEVFNVAVAEGKTTEQAVGEASDAMLSERGLESYLMGAVGSGVTVGGARGVKMIKTPKIAQDKINTNQASISQLKKDLDNPNIPESVKEQLKTKITSLEGENGEIIKHEVEEVSKMSSKDVLDVIDIEKDQDKILREGKEIEDNTELSEESKEILVSEKQRQWEELDVKKKSLLEPEPTEVDDTQSESKTATEKEESTPEPVTNIADNSDNNTPTPVEESTETPTESVQENPVNTNPEQTEIVNVPTEIKLSEKSPSYIVERTGSTITVKDEKGKEPSKPTKRKILDKYADGIDFTQGEKAAITESLEQDATEHLATSNNPAEIADAIINSDLQSLVESNVDYGTRIIAENIGNVSRSSFIENGDVNYITNSIGRSYLRKDGKPLDTFVEELNDDYGTNLTPQDVVEFITSNPNGPDEVSRRVKNEKIVPLQQRFSELTGLPANERFLGKAIKQAQKKESKLENSSSFDFMSEEELIALSKEITAFEQQTYGKQTNTNTEGSLEIADNQESESRPGIQKESPGEIRRDSQGAEAGIDFGSKDLGNFIDYIENAQQKLDEFAKGTLGMNLPVVVAKTALDAMKLAALTAKTTAEILEAGVKAVQNTRWYKNLNSIDQKDVEDNFADYLNQPFKNNPEKTREDLETQAADLQNQGMTDDQIIDQFQTRREKMIVKDFLTRQKPVTEAEARAIVDQSFQTASDAMLTNKKFNDRVSKWFKGWMRRFIDRQYLPKKMLNLAGGSLVRNYIVASKGAAGHAKLIYEEAYDKIYRGLSSKEIKTLDKVIQVRRFIAIDENRKANNLPAVVHPDYINDNVAKAYLADLKNEIGDKKFKDINKRADGYFNEFRNLLDKMYESGIISKDSRDKFFDIDYQPRQFLAFMKDAEGEVNVFNTGETRSSSGISKAQIRKLEDGLDSSLIYDSQYLLSRAINVRAKTIAMNHANKKFVEFINEQGKVVDALKEKAKPTKKEKNTIKYFEELTKRVKDNPIVGLTKDGEPLYLHKKLPMNFKNVTYFKNGVRHSLLMEEEFHDQYFDANKGIFNNSDVKETVVLLTLTGLLKSIATGNNPTFFIANTPRDLMFISIFSGEYGKFVPMNIAKVTKDAVQGIRDIKNGKDNFKNFVKYGGMMDFLHQQGDYKGTSFLNSLTNKYIDNRTRDISKSVFNKLTLDKVQKYSEIGFRMAVFNRSVKNQLKELGLKDLSEVAKQDQVDDIYTNAVASARGITDFNQGGTLTKDLDAFLPYLNAATQGTRVMFDAFQDRPIETMLRTTQAAAMLTAVPIGLSIALIGALRGEDEPEEEKDMTSAELYLKARSGVSKYDRNNYMLFFTGKRTENGEFDYIRIAKAHQLTPFLTLAESVQTEMIKKSVGDESTGTFIEDMKFTLNNNISPIEFSVMGNAARIPLLKAGMTYATGYDFFREQDLSYLRGSVPVVAEGWENDHVEDFYKKIGEEYNVSPVRFKGAVESIITTPSTTPYVGMLYGGLDALTSDKDGKEIISKLGDDLLKSTQRRVNKETSPYNRKLATNAKLKKQFEEIEIESIKTKNKFKELGNKYAAKEITLAEVVKELQFVYKDSPFEGKRMVDKFKDVITYRDASPYVFEIKYAKPKQRALMIVELFGDDLMNEKSLRGDKKNLRKQLFQHKAINKETMAEYTDLIKDVSD